MAGVDRCFGEGELVPACDVKLPLMSLSGIFQTREETIPRDVPYLTAFPEDMTKWKKRIEGKEFKVGLSWSGRPTHSSDYLRSIAEKELLPLLGVKGVRFYGLQKGLPTEQVRLLVEAGLVDISAELTDFAVSAALVANLDLVISVDTAVAHLAGAMGVKTWTLLAYSTDWRWGMPWHGHPAHEHRRDACATPWYPTMQLFRQKSFASWPEVVERVRGELEMLTR